MRVLVVHNLYRSAVPSGENDAVVRDVAELRASGADVLVFTRDSDEIAGFRLPTTLALAARPTWSPTDTAAFARLVDRWQPDVVHLHNPFPLLSPMFVRAAHRRDVALVQTLHNYRHGCIKGSHLRDGRLCWECPSSGFPTPAVRHRCYQGSLAGSLSMAIAQAAHRRTWDLVDLHIGVGPGVADAMVELGVPAERVIVRPNTVRDPGEHDEQGSGMLYAGRLSEEKGVPLLLDAWRRTRARHEHTLTIAGDGDAHVRELVEAASRDDASVRYLGLLDQTQLAEQYRRSALGVFPSIWPESDGLSAVAAMSYARPVVAVQAGAGAWYVDDTNGWTAEPDADSLAAAIDRAFASPDEIAARGAGARAYFLANRTTGTSRPLVDIYTELLARRSSARARPAPGTTTTRSWISPYGRPDGLDVSATEVPVPTGAMGVVDTVSSTAVRPPLARSAGAMLARVGRAHRASSPEPDVAAILTAIGATPDAAVCAVRAGSDEWTMWVEHVGRVSTHVTAVRGDDRALRHEVGTLRRIARAAGSTRLAPSVVFADTIDGWFVSATTPPPGRLPGIDDLEAVAALARTLTVGVDGQPWRHGDLAPWHVRIGTDGPAAIAWGRAVPERHPLHDLTSYLVYLGATGAMSVEEVLRQLTAADGFGVRELAAIDEPPAAAPALVARAIAELSADGRMAGDAATFGREVRSRVGTEHA